MFSRGEDGKLYPSTYHLRMFFQEWFEMCDTENELDNVRYLFEDLIKETYDERYKLLEQNGWIN